MALITVFSSTWVQGGDTYIVNIKKEGGTGSVDAPFIEMVELFPVEKFSGEIMPGIQNSRCRVSLLDQNHTNQGRISALLAVAQISDYFLEVTKNAAVFFEGFIEPATFRRSTGWADQMIEISASDFGVLKNAEFDLTGKENLNVYFYEAIRIVANQSACKVYWANGLTHYLITSGSPLNNLKLNADAFLSVQDNSWAGVLKRICNTFGFRIQRYGSFILVWDCFHTGNNYDIYTLGATTASTDSTNTTVTQLSVATSSVPRESEFYEPFNALRKVEFKKDHDDAAGFGAELTNNIVGFDMTTANDTWTVGFFDDTIDLFWTFTVGIKYTVDGGNQFQTEVVRYLTVTSTDAQGNVTYWNGSIWTGSASYFEHTINNTDTLGNYEDALTPTLPTIGNGGWIKISGYRTHISGSYIATATIFNSLSFTASRNGAGLYKGTLNYASLVKTGADVLEDDFIQDATTGVCYSGLEFYDGTIWRQTADGWSTNQTLAQRLAINILARFRDVRLVYSMETLEANNVLGAGARILYNSKNLRLFAAGFNFTENRFTLDAFEEANSATSISSGNQAYG